MSYLRIYFAQAILPCIRVIARVGFDKPGFELLKIGSCVFFAPPSFLNTASRAMDRIAKLDPNLSAEMKQRKLMLWPYLPRTICFHGLFSVSKWYLKRGEDGLITCVLYAYFSDRILSAVGLRESLVTNVGVITEKNYRFTREWLERHGFPEKLVDKFRLLPLLRLPNSGSNMGV